MRTVSAYCTILLVGFLSWAPTTLAQYSGNKDTVQGYLVLIMFFIHSTILPLLFSIALLFFLINATRYFIIEGADSGGRERAKELALYGIGAFVFLISIWGIVNMFVNGLGIANDRSICPDYLDSWCNYSGYGGLGSPSEGNRFLDSGSDDSGATFEERCYEYGGVTNCTTVPTTKRCYEYGGVTDCP